MILTMLCTFFKHGNWYWWSVVSVFLLYFWELRISNLDKTIETTYTVTNPGGAPTQEKCSGIWHL